MTDKRPTQIKAQTKRQLPREDTLPDPDKRVLDIRPTAPIVPDGRIAGQALTILIAIMSFIASLTLGGVSLVDQSAKTWQSQISREATIQIRPGEGFDMDTALAEARAIAASFEGVQHAQIISPSDTAALLEPWLGTGLNMDELPIPRLVVLTIDENNPPDFAALRTAVTETVDNATLDDHRAWLARLISMANTTTWVGIAILILVLGALTLTVVFATRGAMAGNQDVIEVLHFVGARGGYIAGQFQRRFLIIGLRGALIGGLAAIAVFFITSLWANSNLASIEGEQLSVLFGNFSIGLSAYIGVAILIFIVGILTAVTTRYTVLDTLHEIDEKRADPSHMS